MNLWFREVYKSLISWVSKQKEPRRSWVHLGKNWILLKEQAVSWREQVNLEWSKENRSSMETLRINWTTHRFFIGEGITLNFSTIDFSNHTNSQSSARVYHHLQSWAGAWYNPGTQCAPGAKCLKTTARHSVCAVGHTTSPMAVRPAKCWPETKPDPCTRAQSLCWASSGSTGTCSTSLVL